MFDFVWKFQNLEKNHDSAKTIISWNSVDNESLHNYVMKLLSARIWRLILENLPGSLFITSRSGLFELEWQNKK